MNSTAKELGLIHTFYSNPHGMSFPKNRSTAEDICKLAAFAVKNKVFKQIVNTKSHMCYIITEGGYSYRVAR